MHRSPTFPEPQFKSGRVEVAGGSRVNCAIRLESDTHALLQFERPVMLTIELKLPLAGGTYWQIAADSIRGILQHQGVVLHACEAETSMLQALSPETVRPLDPSLRSPLVPGLSAIEGVNPGVYRWQQLRTRSPLGLIGEAWAATPEKGRRLLDAIAGDVADALSNQALWDAPI